MHWCWPLQIFHLHPNKQITSNKSNKQNKILGSSLWTRAKDFTFNNKSIKYMGQILKRSNGDLVIVTENIGLLRYDPLRDECIKYPYPIKYDCYHLITTSIDKDNDTIYIFCVNKQSRNVIIIIDLQHDKTRLVNPGLLDNLHAQRGASIFIQAKFHIWFNSFICVYNAITNKISRYDGYAPAFDGHTMIHIPSRNQVLTLGSADTKIRTYDTDDHTFKVLAHGRSALSGYVYGGHTSLASAGCLLTDDEKYVILFGAHFGSIDILDIDNNKVYRSQIECYRGWPGTYMKAFVTDSVCVNNLFINGYLWRYCRGGTDCFSRDLIQLIIKYYGYKDVHLVYFGDPDQGLRTIGHWKIPLNIITEIQT